jgi:fumarate reductase subunit C
MPPAETANDTSQQLVYELISGASGLALAVFMWGHMFLVGSILFGQRGFDWLAGGLEAYYIAQPTIVVILALFLAHAVFASRKIPSRLRERREMFALARRLRTAPADWPGVPAGDPRLRPHIESWLWIWQVRTGMVMLVLGSFHLILMTLDVFTPLFGDITGIEANTSMARVSGGLLVPYAALLLCVEFHAGAGLYRLAVKWGIGARFSRRTLWRLEKLIFWVFLGLGVLILLVLAGWIAPPLAFLLV